MMILQGFVLAFAYSQIITASALLDVEELNLKDSCPEFGIVVDNHELEKIALLKLQELRCPLDLDEAIPSTTDPHPFPLFVIELYDHFDENGTSALRPHARKNAIVVFRLESKREHEVRSYFFVSLTLWEGTDEYQSKVNEWCLTYVCQSYTTVNTEAKIRSYFRFKYYNYLKTPWTWTSDLKAQYCTFGFESISIMYSISGQTKDSTGQLELFLTEKPMVTNRSEAQKRYLCNSQAALDKYIWVDVHRWINQSQLKPATAPRRDVNFRPNREGDYLLKKQFTWRNENYWFLQYESSEIMFIQAVEVRTVFEEPVICLTWYSFDIEVGTLSEDEKNEMGLKKCFEYLAIQNVFLEERTPVASWDLIEGASLEWEVDDKEIINLIYVLRVEFKNSVQKSGRIANYVSIHVTCDCDKNPLKYHYAVGSINRHGDFQYEYKTQAGIDTIEETWERIGFYYKHFLRPRYLQLERVFGTWQSKFCEEHKPQEFTWNDILETDVNHIVLGSFDHVDVTGVHDFGGVALELEECDVNIEFSSNISMEIPARTESVEKFLINFYVISTTEPVTYLTDKSPAIQKAVKCVCSLISERLGVPVKSHEIQLTFRRPLITNLIRCDCVYNGKTKCFAILSNRLASPFLELLHLSKLQPVSEKKLDEQEDDKYVKEEDVLASIPFVEHWNFFSEKYKPGPFYDELISQLELFRRKMNSSAERIRPTSDIPLTSNRNERSIRFDFSQCELPILETLGALNLYREQGVCTYIKLLAFRSVSPCGNWKQVVFEANGAKIGFGLIEQSPQQWTVLHFCYVEDTEFWEEMDEARFKSEFLGSIGVVSPSNSFDNLVANLVKWKYPDSATTQFESGRIDSKSGRVYAKYSLQVEEHAWYIGVLGMLTETERDGVVLQDNSNWTLLYITEENQYEEVFEVLLEYESNMVSIKPGVEDWFTPVPDSEPLKILEGVKDKILSKLREKSEVSKELDGLELSIVLREVQRQSADGTNFFFLCELIHAGNVGCGYFFVVFDSSPQSASESPESIYAIKGVSMLCADIVKTAERAQAYTVRRTFRILKCSV